jgi:AraC family transcriptional regulator
MPPPSLILRGNNGNSVDRAVAYGRTAFSRSATDPDPITAYLDGLHESGSGPPSHAIIEGGMLLAFRHLDLVLAIATQGADVNAILNGKYVRAEAAKRQDRVPCQGVADGPDPIEGVRRARAAGKPEDHVIKRLSDALAATENADDHFRGICCDALRLAIVTRLLGLQSETLRSREWTGGANEAGAERKMRALQKWRLKRVVEFVDNRLSGKITLLDLAAVAGLSRMHFACQFRVATGFRPHEYLLRRRIQRAEELLRQSTMTLCEIAMIVGFQTQAHFTTVFKRIVGDTPYQWRNARCFGGRQSK